MGLVINKLLGSLTMGELFAQLEIEPSGASAASGTFRRPVDAGRGFVLHTADYREEATLHVDGDIAVTATLEVSARDRQGPGPRQSLFVLAMPAGARSARRRDPGHGWLSVAADSDIVFSGDDDAKWGRALAKPASIWTMLSSDAGHAWSRPQVPQDVDPSQSSRKMAKSRWSCICPR